MNDATQPVAIPRTLANRLLTMAQQMPAAEICGLVARNSQGEYQVFPIDNIAENKSRVFEMHPQQQIDAFRHMREQQQSLFAIFHSHPHSDALPSSKDINEAAYGDVLNIIISLGIEGVLDMRGFYYRDQQFSRVELEIT